MYYYKQDFDFGIVCQNLQECTQVKKGKYTLHVGFKSGAQCLQFQETKNDVLIRRLNRDIYFCLWFKLSNILQAQVYSMKVISRMFCSVYKPFQSLLTTTESYTKRKIIFILMYYLFSSGNIFICNAVQLICNQ